MARFKDLPHGQHVQHAEMVSHIRPMHWGYRFSYNNHLRAARSVERSQFIREVARVRAEFNPALLEPGKLISYPLMNLYQRLKKGNERMFRSIMGLSGPR